MIVIISYIMIIIIIIIIIIKYIIIIIIIIIIVIITIADRRGPRGTMRKSSISESFTGGHVDCGDVRRGT